MCVLFAFEMGLAEIIYLWGHSDPNCIVLYKCGVFESILHGIALSSAISELNIAEVVYVIHAEVSAKDTVVW